MTSLASVRVAEANQDRRQRKCNDQRRHEERGEPVPSTFWIKAHKAEVNDQGRSKCRAKRGLCCTAKKHPKPETDCHRQQEQNDECFHGWQRALATRLRTA